MMLVDDDDEQPVGEVLDGDVIVFLRGFFARRSTCQTLLEAVASRLTQEPAC